MKKNRNKQKIVGLLILLSLAIVLFLLFMSGAKELINCIKGNGCVLGNAVPGQDWRITLLIITVVGIIIMFVREWWYRKIGVDW